MIAIGSSTGPALDGVSSGKIAIIDAVKQEGSEQNYGKMVNRINAHVNVL